MRTRAHAGPREIAGPATSVRIHESVINRIRSGTDSYAPIVLPEHYELVCHHGTIVTPDLIGVADAKRWTRQERVWDEVWKRRIVYFATVAASLILLALPALQLAWPPGVCHLAVWPASRIAAGLGTCNPGFLPGPKALVVDRRMSKQPLFL